MESEHIERRFIQERTLNVDHCQIGVFKISPRIRITDCDAITTQRNSFTVTNAIICNSLTQFSPLNDFIIKAIFQICILFSENKDPLKVYCFINVWFSLIVCVSGHLFLLSHELFYYNYWKEKWQKQHVFQVTDSLIFIYIKSTCDISTFI